MRLFHWLLVAAVSAAFLSAFETSPIVAWHQTAGWVAAVLIAFRIAWGFVGGENARFGALNVDALGRHLGQLVRARVEPTLGHNPLGAFSVLGLLTLTAITIATGALMQHGWREGPHELIAFSLLALILVHVTAVGVMTALTGENLVRAMVTGDKMARLHPGAVDAKGPGLAAWLGGAAAFAASAYVALLIDPAAFGPHPPSDRREAAASAGGAHAVEAAEPNDAH